MKLHPLVETELDHVTNIAEIVNDNLAAIEAEDPREERVKAALTSSLQSVVEAVNAYRAMHRDKLAGR